MKVKIHYTYYTKEATPNDFVVYGYSVDDIREKADRELEKRGINPQDNDNNVRLEQID